MSDRKKTKAQLIEELKQLRQQAAEFQSAEDMTKRLLIEMQRSEQLLRSVIDSSPDWVFVKDQEHRFVMVNQGFANALHVTPNECIGMNELELGFPEEMVKGDPEKGTSGFWADDQQVLDSGEPLINPYEPATLAGEDRIFHTIKTPLRDVEGEIWGLLGIVRDVTSSKRLLDDLGRLNTQLQTAAEVSRAATGILDPDELIQQTVDLAQKRFDLYYVGLFLVDQTGEWTREPGKWAVLRAGSGQAGQQMLARGHKLEIGGESMIGWCVANKQARIALDVGEEAVRFDNPFLPATRSEMALPLVARGQVIGAMTVQSEEEAAFSEEDIGVLQTMADQLANAIGTVRLYDQAQKEIAERKQAEEALRATEERFSLAVQGSNDGIWDWDIENSSLYWSPRLKELLGYADDELDIDFETFDSMLHPDDKEHVGVAIETHLKDRATYDVEERLRTKSGDYRWFRARGQAIWDEAGEPVRMTGSTTDITEHKQAEVERERLLTETENLAKELAVLNELGQALTASLSVEEVLEETYRQASRLVDTTNFYIGLYDPEKDEVVFPLDVSESEIDKQITAMPASQGMTGHVIRSRTSLLIEENVRERQKELGLEMVGQEAQSWLGVPLMIGDQVVGVMAVQSHTTPRLYDEHDRDLLTAIASQAAIAIQNARLFERAQSRGERERLVRTITDKVHRSADTEAIMRVTLQELSHMLGASKSVVRLGTQEQLLSRTRKG